MRKRYPPALLIFRIRKIPPPRPGSPFPAAPAPLPDYFSKSLAAKHLRKTAPLTTTAISGNRPGGTRSEPEKVTFRCGKGFVLCKQSISVPDFDPLLFSVVSLRRILRGEIQGARKPMVNKVCSRKDVLDLFAASSGKTFMLGGFATKGVPVELIDLLVESGAQNLHIVSNDTGDPDLAQGRLVHSRQATSYVCSHIGKNTEASGLAASGEMKVELCPQGTLAERMRAGGVGLGGVLAKTGLGTIIEENAEKIDIDGETYLLWRPLRSDISLVNAKKADTYGNLVYHGTSQNFNPMVAMAGKITIAEVEEVVPMGSIDPDHVGTPGVFVNMVFVKEKKGKK
jgi:acetate CoA/acetoacetate CoA-transferase alpha subunit